MHTIQSTTPPATYHPPTSTYSSPTHTNPRPPPLTYPPPPQETPLPHVPSCTQPNVPTPTGHVPPSNSLVAPPLIPSNLCPLHVHPNPLFITHTPQMYPLTYPSIYPTQRTPGWLLEQSVGH